MYYYFGLVTFINTQWNPSWCIFVQVTKATSLNLGTVKHLLLTLCVNIPIG